MAAFLAIEPGWLDHPKIENLPNDARILWIAAALHAVSLETDGTISRRIIPILTHKTGVSAKRGLALVDSLVAAGLWIDCGDRYLIHDFLKYNQSKAMREAKRESWRKQKAKAAGIRDSCAESDAETAENPSRIPRPSLPCLALPTEKALPLPHRIPTRNGQTNNQPETPPDQPINPPTDEGRAAIAEIRRRMGWTT